MENIFDICHSAANRYCVDHEAVIPDRFTKIDTYLVFCAAVSADGQGTVLRQFPFETIAHNAYGILIHFQFAYIDPISC